MDGKMRNFVITGLKELGWKHREDNDDVFIRYPVRMVLAIKDNEIFLDDIKVEYFHRDRGEGSLAMEELCSIADNNAMKISLAPVPEVHSDMYELMKFYEKFGFEGDKNYLVRKENTIKNEF